MNCFERGYNRVVYNLDWSPTPTPENTRAGSPIHNNIRLHTLEETNIATAMGRFTLEERDKSVAVSIVDGSAAVPTITKFKYLAVYFLFNLGLTLFNKFLMTKVRLLHHFSWCCRYHLSSLLFRFSYHPISWMKATTPQVVCYYTST